MQLHLLQEKNVSLSINCFPLDKENTEKIKGNVQIVHNVIIIPIQFTGKCVLKKRSFLQKFEINANGYFELILRTWNYDFRIIWIFLFITVATDPSRKLYNAKKELRKNYFWSYTVQEIVQIVCLFHQHSQCCGLVFLHFVGFWCVLPLIKK